MQNRAQEPALTRVVQRLARVRTAAPRQPPQDSQRGDDTQRTQRSCRIREGGVPRDAPAVPSRVAGSRARAPRPDAAGDTAAATALDASGITTYPDPTDHERVWVRDVKFWVLRRTRAILRSTTRSCLGERTTSRKNRTFCSFFENARRRAVRGGGMRVTVA